MKNNLQALSDAIHLELDPLDKSPAGKLMPGREHTSQIEFVLCVDDRTGLWDLSALHKNLGALSTLRPDERPDCPYTYCVKDGHLVAPPRSGLARRKGARP